MKEPRGFATEALTAVLRYLTGHENIGTVNAWCASDNIGSRKALPERSALPGPVTCYSKEMRKRGDIPLSFSVVRVAGFEPTASWSRTKHATICATPGY